MTLLLCLTAGCSTTQFQSSSDRKNASEQPENSFLNENTAPAVDPIYSVQLHPVSRPNSGPIIELNSSDQLQLTFESIGFESRSYQYYFTHHNPDGSESGLSEDQFLEGFSKSNLSSGTVSRSSRPYYRQFSVQFPNRELKFKVSGYYMLHVEDSDSGDLLFSTPFFVFENEGDIRSSAKTIQTPRQQLRTMHRLTGHYLLPDFVDQPQFDLSFYFVQNQFWGRALSADELDFSDPDEVRFETSSEETFPGDYEFRILNLNNISKIRSSALEIKETDDVTKLTLFDDAEGFTDPVTAGTPSVFGASTSLNSIYLNVEFRLDADIEPDDEPDLYLVGDFNQWSVDDKHRLRYDSEMDRWVTKAMMKEGTYRYKYVLVENGVIDDLRFDTLFQNVRQEYHAFVYFRDFNEYYTRLLQVNTFYH